MLSLRGQFVMSLLIMAFCALMYCASYSVEEVYLDPAAIGPMDYPQTLLALMFIIAPFLPFTQKVQVDSTSLTQAALPIAGIIISMLIYAFSLRYLGFLLSGFVLLVLIFRILKYKTIFHQMLMAAIITIVFWYVFAKFVLMPLPVGVWTHI